MGLPSGTVTFVLGDVERSSRLWEEHGDRMGAALAQLDGLVEARLAEHDGARPIEQGEGDSFVAAFGTASDAIAFALALQRGIGEQDFDGVRLSVRLGVHTGEATASDAGTYRGETLNRCGRLRALGAGGQVLVSGTTADLVAGRLPDGAWLEDLGLHRLRDLSRAERLHVLRHPSLPSDDLKLRRLGTEATNLPVQLTSFIGRQRELKELADLLEDARLVTLTGAGGSGKTRLAVRAAAEHVGRQETEAWLVDLAPVTDPELVMATVAAALGIGELPFQGVEDTVLARLQDREVQLVVDNCEHLVDATRGMVETLLRGCPGLGIIATSREPLGAEGEVIYQVAPLGLPAGTADADCDAVRLFAERAGLVRPGFEVTEESAPAVVEICQRLDGIPLALELAAARTRLLSPAQIAAQLTDRFALLTGGRHGALPRQRTLEASVEWSYGLLSDAEQHLFRCLSVFTGGWTLEAAEAIGDADRGGPPVFETLSGLVDKSMVVVDDDDETPRFRMLETVRHYALQRLIEAGEAPPVRDRHLAYFVDFAQAAAAELRGPRMVAALDRLEREIDNLRAADDWTEESDQRAVAQGLVGPLEEFWYRRHAAEGYRRVRAALEAPGGDLATRARALSSASWLAWNVGDIEHWDVVAAEFEAIAHELGDDRLLAIGDDFRAYVTMFGGDWDAARPMFETAVERLDAVGENWYYVDALWGLAIGAGGNGEYDAAADYTGRAVERARAVGNPFQTGLSVGWSAWVDFNRGRLVDVGAKLDEMRQLAVLVGDDTLTASNTVQRALLAAYQDNMAEASALADEAVDLAWGHQVMPAIGYAEFARGYVDHVTGDAGSAAAHFEAAEPYLELAAAPALTAFGRALQAEAALLGDDLETARDRTTAALECAERPLARAARPTALLTAARLERAAGSPSESRSLAVAALDLEERGGGCLMVIEALEVIADLALDAGRPEVAVRLVAAAHEAREAIAYAPREVVRQGRASTIDAARRSLSEDAFESAWSAGAAMALADAAAAARAAFDGA